MTEGICFFAYNNSQIDYISLANLAASYTKKYLDKPVCLLTDEGGWEWAQESISKKRLYKSFDDVVITTDAMKPNQREHHDSPYTKFKAQFNNSNKHKVFEYSPYDKTLLLDIDYIVKTDFLKNVFESKQHISMFNQAINLRNDKPHQNEQFLFAGGIPMWWSTVVYFDKSPQSKLFFDLWAHVADNYDFYQFLYNFPGKLFRTDYCVSIAVHILNGMNSGDYVDNFSNSVMQNLSQKDDIVEIKDMDDWIVLANDKAEHWKDLIVRHNNYDVHVMNKRALGRVATDLWRHIDG